jgi:hypothetical protein
MAFLAKYAEQMEERKKQKPDQKLLEARLKLKSLYLFMMNAICPNFPQMKQYLHSYD